MTEGVSYKYLGFLLNPELDWAPTIKKAREKFESRLKAIDESELLPLMRIETANSWAVPVWTYLLPLVELPKGELEALDRTLAACCRKWTSSDTGSGFPGVPGRFFFEPARRGGLGMTSIAEAQDRGRMAFFGRILTAKNPGFVALAKSCARAGRENGKGILRAPQGSSIGGCMLRSSARARGPIRMKTKPEHTRRPLPSGPSPRRCLRGL